MLGNMRLVRYVGLVLFIRSFALPLHAQTVVTAAHVSNVASTLPSLAPSASLGEVVRFVEESGRPIRMYLGDTWIDRVPEH
jgi:hypothetical protein